MAGENEEVIPESEFKTAIDICCRDAKVAHGYQNATQGARMLMAVLFYASVYRYKLEDARINACLQQIIDDITENDVLYVLKYEEDAKFRDYLSKLIVPKDIPTSVPVNSRNRYSSPTYEELQEQVREERRSERTRTVIHLAGKLIIYSIVLGIASVLGVMVLRKVRNSNVESAPVSTASADVDIKTLESVFDGSPIKSTVDKKRVDELLKADSSAGEKETVVANVHENSSTKPPVQNTFDFRNCKDKLVVIGNNGKGSNGGASGFLVKMQGKMYFVTNEHVTRGPQKWIDQLCLLDGRYLHLGRFYVADSQDLVRFEVLGDFAGFELEEETPNNGDEIAIHGNSDGGGGATSAYGKVLSVGPSRIEVDSNVVCGNSGSPVINSKGKVIGVFTYVTQDNKRNDWVKKGTRYNDVRRWAVRFTNVKWLPVDWEAYRKNLKDLNDTFEFFQRLRPFVALATDDFKASDYEYGLTYDRFSRGGNHMRQPFNDMLCELSSTSKAWQENSKKLNDSLKVNGGDNEAFSGYIKSTESFSMAMTNALFYARKCFSETEWVVPHFSNDVTSTFLPMHAILDFLDVAIEDQTRFVANCRKGASGVTGEVFDKTKRSLVIVECGDAVGSGFIAVMRGNKYVFTNRHVIRSGEKVKVHFLDGEVIQLGSCQIADDRDLVRFPVNGKLPALEFAEGIPNAGDAVHVFGNSDGAGVLTELHGIVQGVGPKLIETNAKFIRGNSGSPVLNSEGKVIAVATFAYRSNNDEDWVKAGTRFANSVRRFAYRVQGVKWIDANRMKVISSEWASPEVCGSFGIRSLRVQNVAKTYFLTGYVDASLLTDNSAFTRPILHITCLYEVSNHRYVQSVIIDEPDTYMVRSAQMSQDEISAMSCNKGSLGMSSRNQRKLRFGKTTHGVDDRFMTFADRKNKVTLIRYRLELWQNGYVVAECESIGGGRNLPYDWYYWNKYPNLFEYW